MKGIGWMVSIVLGILPGYINGQSKYDNTWIIGYNYCDDAPNCFVDAAEGMILDFKTSPPTVTTQPIPFEMKSISVISHPVSGELQYYTNGCSIINADHEVMENGEDINLSPYHDVYCGLGINSFHSDLNSIISLPTPGMDNHYHMIHRPKSFVEPSFTSIWYSTIDMNKNGGMGAVMDKNKVLIANNSFPGGYVTACKHANNTDWWILMWERYNPICHIILLDRDSIYVHHSQSIGNVGPNGVGQAVFSPDGSKYVWYDLINGVHTYDFDRETGELSKHKTLSVNAYYQYGRGGVSISPNSRFAYLSAQDTLYQLDLWEEDPYQGLEVIDTINYLTVFGIKLNFSNSMLGPDCKIYISTGFTWECYHIIHSPDEKGKACGLQKLGLTFPFPNSNSAIANNPHYRMGEDKVCNPLSTSLFPPSWYVERIVIYPNPSTDNVHITSYQPVKYCITSITGGHILESDFFDKEHSVDISMLASGIYLIHSTTQSGAITVRKFIKQ